MDLPKIIDLHMHTTVSDGTDTPAEILVRVKEAGIELFSVTDHDAVKGCLQIQAVLGPGDPQFITGAEFSAMSNAKLHKYVSCRCALTKLVGYQNYWKPYNRCKCMCFSFKKIYSIFPEVVNKNILYFVSIIIN